ncbi:MAG: hypothetical protein IPM39_15065 [Chloroflexi bacterium]|nr:hypothetical protein [Chloroflexota bacterium]
MSANYPWYNLINTKDLEQGDLLLHCPVIKPTWTAAHLNNQDQESSEFSLFADQFIFDVVVLTQSCDLINEKIDTVLVCPFTSVEIFLNHNFPDWNDKEQKQFREDVRRGNRPGYHLIAECEIPNFISGIKLVDFYNIFSVPKSLLVRLAERQSPRIRLMPPYREHLGQAFARFFMRIGLPIDIPNQK